MQKTREQVSIFKFVRHEFAFEFENGVVCSFFEHAMLMWTPGPPKGQDGTEVRKPESSSWLRCLALLYLSCVTLGYLLDLSVPRSPCR